MLLLGWFSQVIVLCVILWFEFTRPGGGGVVGCGGGCDATATYSELCVVYSHSGYVVVMVVAACRGGVGGAGGDGGGDGGGGVGVGVGGGDAAATWFSCS